MPELFESDDEQAAADVTGRGEAADGLISAVVGVDGRLVELQLDPALRGTGRRGPALDSEVLSAQIIEAVNAALDDLQAKIRNGLGSIGDKLAIDLDRLAEDFERTLNQVNNDIARAERRLER
jgi:DNA-binding protein YbaB